MFLIRTKQPSHVNEDNPYRLATKQDLTKYIYQRHVLDNSSFCLELKGSNIMINCMLYFSGVKNQIMSRKDCFYQLCNETEVK